MENVDTYKYSLKTNLSYNRFQKLEIQTMFSQMTCAWMTWAWGTLSKCSTKVEISYILREVTKWIF